LTVTTANVGGQQANNTTLTVTIPSGIAVDSVSSLMGACSSQPGSVQCSLGPIGTLESLTVDMTLRVVAAGSFAIAASSSASNDTNTANNVASATVAVAAAPVAEPAPTTSTQGGSASGGGGSMPLGTLAVGLLGLLRRRRSLTT